MEYLIALIALITISVVYVYSSNKSRKEIEAVRKNRHEIYRACFLRGLAGILAKIAKADGTVTLEEVNVACKFFNDMGLESEDRDLCFDTFKIAKDSNLPLNYYASIFAPYSTKDSKELIYEIVWDVTAADGRLDPGEEKALKELVGWLSIDPAEFDRNQKRCAEKFTGLSDAAKEAGAKVNQVLNG